MSVGFGFSVSDIVTAYRLASNIYDNCFTRAQAADVKYAQFRQDIKHLGDSLAELEKIIINADNRGSYPRRREQALRVLPDVTGDFYKTLTDCEGVIRKHASLQHGRSDALANFQWWRSADREVTALRERVRFHITKVAFIAKPFETQLLLGIDRGVQRLIRDVDRLTRIVINGADQVGNVSDRLDLNVPEWILTRFNNAISLNCPSSFDEGPDWPLQEGFDALVFHFSKSTIEFNARPELGVNVPQPSQYLNLLKCAWIVQHLKASSYFRDTGNDSLWADYMRRLVDDLRAEFGRFDARQLIAPADDVVSILSGSHYAIWVEDAPSPQDIDMAEERPLEDKILEISLPEVSSARQSSLTILRKSDTEFRLVTTTKRADNPHYSYSEGSYIDLASGRMIPSYAIPESNPHETNNIILCNDRGQSPQWLSLCAPHDVASVQQALLGYRVHYDMSGFSWCINGSSEEGDWGEGRLQLWQPKPLTVILPANGNGFANGRNGTTLTVTPQLPQMELGGEPLLPGFSELGLGESQSTRYSTASSPPAPHSPLSATSSTPRSPTSNHIPSSAEHFGGTMRSQSTMDEYIGAQYQPDRRSQSYRGLVTTPASKWGSETTERQSTRRSSNTLLTRSSVASHVSGPRGEGVEFIRPEVPILVIFTVCQAKYTFLHVKLEPHIFVNPKSCACKSSRKECKRAVLESSRRDKPFIVYKYSVQQDGKKGLFEWNLALFRLPLRQDLRQIPTVEEMKSLDLAFNTLPAKNKFLEELKELEDIRGVEQNEYIKERMRRARS